MHSRSLFALLIAFGCVGASPARAEETKPSAERQRLLVLDATGSEVEASTLTTTTEILTVELSRRRDFEVLSGADIRRLVALEADRVSVGCDLDASCLADIAGALGARYVVSSTVGKLGTLLVVTLSLFDASEGRAVSREVIEVESPELLPARLRQGASNLVAGFLGTERVDVPPPTVAAPASPPSTPAPAESSPIVDLTLRDVIVIVGRVALAAGIGTLALGAISFCGGYSGAIFGTWIAQEKSNGDLLIVAIPVAGPIINLARNGIDQYDVTDIIALVTSTLFQSAGIAILFAGGVCTGAGGFLVGFDDTVAGVVDGGEPKAPAPAAAQGGSVDDAVAMVF